MHHLTTLQHLYATKYEKEKELEAEREREMKKRQESNGMKRISMDAERMAKAGKLKLADVISLSPSDKV